MNRLETVQAVAEDGEHRHPPQCPRNVVHEDVLAPEEDRRPEDRVRQARLDQGPLDLGLAAEIFQRRILRRVRDADVDDATDTRFLGRREERA